MNETGLQLNIGIGLSNKSVRSMEDELSQLTNHKAIPTVRPQSHGIVLWCALYTTRCPTRIYNRCSAPLRIHTRGLSELTFSVMAEKDLVSVELYWGSLKCASNHGQAGDPY